MPKWEFIRSETLGEEEKRHKEKIKDSEIVSEDKERNMRIMRDSNGHIFVTHIEWTPKPSLYGVAVKSEGDATPDEIENAKELVLEEVIRSVRDVAKRKPDEFFIIHTPSQNPIKKMLTGEICNESSVGVKFALPTVLDDEEANGRI